MTRDAANRACATNGHCIEEAERPIAAQSGDAQNDHDEIAAAALRLLDRLDAVAADR